MIVAESQVRRAFVGRLETGQELVATVRDFCVRERVETGVFTGFGYLREPTVRIFRPEHKRYLRAPETLEGTYLATTVRATISFHGDAREVHMMATLAHTQSGAPVMAEILAADVVSMEFLLHACDDVRMFRDDDEATGLRRWVMMDVAGGQEAARAPAAAAAPEAVDDAPADDVEVEVGDFLRHPRLGLCEVVEGTDETSIVIRLSNGRVVELHRAIIRVEPGAPHDGQRVFDVSIRRKKG